MLVVLDLILYDLCLNELGDVVRWEDTDLSRTLVCLKQTWSSSLALVLALATVCAKRFARARGAWRARGARALVRMAEALPSAPLRFSLRSGPLGTHSIEACCLQGVFPPH